MKDLFRLPSPTPTDHSQHCAWPPPFVGNSLFFTWNEASAFQLTVARPQPVLLPCHGPSSFWTTSDILLARLFLVSPSVHPGDLGFSPWQYWHVGPDHSLLWGGCGYVVGCPAAPLATTRQMPAAHTPVVATKNVCRNSSSVHFPIKKSLEKV